MSRNYVNETKWQKEKYIDCRAKIEREEYETDFIKIKDEIGFADFIRQSIELYRKQPNLFKKQDK